MDTNTILTKVVPPLNPSIEASGWLRLLYDPPKAFVMLAVGAIVSWAFREVVKYLAERLRQGNSADISVMLCMSLMWVYGFIEATIQHGWKHDDGVELWCSHPFVYATAGSVFMLASMALHLKGRHNLAEKALGKPSK